MEISLELDEIRVVVDCAIKHAGQVIEIYETSAPTDTRPRIALEAAQTFASGGPRLRALRNAAMGALKSANETDDVAAGQAARASMSACAAAFLHPLAKSTQVKHILGAAVHAAHATELTFEGDDVGYGSLRMSARNVSPVFIEVLRRYPLAPAGGGRVGELLRAFDTLLRNNEMTG